MFQFRACRIGYVGFGALHRLRLHGRTGTTRTHGMLTFHSVQGQQQRSMLFVGGFYCQDITEEELTRWSSSSNVMLVRIPESRIPVSRLPQVPQPAVEAVAHHEVPEISSQSEDDVSDSSYVMVSEFSECTVRSC